MSKGGLTFLEALNSRKPMRRAIPLFYWWLHDDDEWTVVDPYGDEQAESHDPGWSRADYNATDWEIASDAISV
jgi:hypothetical protein